MKLIGIILALLLITPTFADDRTDLINHVVGPCLTDAVENKIGSTNRQKVINYLLNFSVNNQKKLMEIINNMEQASKNLTYLGNSQRYDFLYSMCENQVRFMSFTNTF